MLYKEKMNRMTFTGGHRRSAGDAMGGLIGLFFHPQGRVYGVWILWFVACIWTGPPYGGIIWFQLVSMLFLTIAVLVASIGALQEWKKLGIAFMILGSILVTIGSFVAQIYSFEVWSTTNYIFYTLILSPIITAGYLLSIFGSLCVGYYAHVNRESRLYNRSQSLILMVVGTILIFFPLFLMLLGGIFISMNLIILGTPYYWSDYPIALLYSINALYQIVLLMTVLFGAAVLYGVVRKRIGVILFLIGFSLIVLPFLAISPIFNPFWGYYSGVPIMAIGGVWIGAPLSELKYHNHLREPLE